MSPTPGLISEYLILFSTKLFPPFTLSQGQDEACWSTGKGWRRGMGALQPSSFPCSQPQHKSIGSILRFGPVQMGSENWNSHPSSDIITAQGSGQVPPCLAPTFPSETHDCYVPSLSWIPLALPSPPLSCCPGLSLHLNASALCTSPGIHQVSLLTLTDSALTPRCEAQASLLASVKEQKQRLAPPPHTNVSCLNQQQNALENFKTDSFKDG